MLVVGNICNECTVFAFCAMHRLLAHLYLRLCVLYSSRKSILTMPIPIHAVVEFHNMSQAITSSITALYAFHMNHAHCQTPPYLQFITNKLMLPPAPSFLFRPTCKTFRSSTGTRRGRSWRPQEHQWCQGKPLWQHPRELSRE